ncbi:MAG: serine/threonine protein kinase [Deltaproteobacteria bacterium]|nr:serine/threonine protein kinase [Deltaproteobacteria bacterium]
MPTLDPAMLGASKERPGVGSVVGGRYRLEAQLGAGAMGAVFRGVQLGLGRRVAAKLLLDAEPTIELVRRFYQEAKSLSELRHPNLVSLLDFGIDEKTQAPFLVLELVEGQTLDSILAHGKLDETQALRVALQLARGLAEAHSKGVVHRDLKPGNLMVTSLADGGDLIKIVDFGLATLVTADGDRIRQITATGLTVGTPLYMSPEQVRSSAVDARSDLYSLGCMLFQLLTGHPPFSGASVAMIALAHVATPPPMGLLSASAAPVQDLVARLLKKDRDERPRSAFEVVEILESLGLDGPLHINRAEVVAPSSPLSVVGVDPAEMSDAARTEVDLKTASLLDQTAGAPEVATRSSSAKVTDVHVGASMASNARLVAPARAGSTVLIIAAVAVALALAALVSMSVRPEVSPVTSGPIRK